MHLFGDGCGVATPIRTSQSLDFAAKATVRSASPLRPTPGALYEVTTNPARPMPSDAFFLCEFVRLDFARTKGNRVGPDDLVVMYLCGARDARPVEPEQW